MLFCLCNPRSGGVPGRVPHQARSSSLGERVKKLDPEKAWLAAELGLGFRAPNLESIFIYQTLRESDSFRTMLGKGARVKKCWLLRQTLPPTG